MNTNGNKKNSLPTAAADTPPPKDGEINQSISVNDVSDINQLIRQALAYKNSPLHR